MNKGLLSIVLFCRNCEATIDTALRSVTSQDEAVELLVMDGGSTDGTVDTIRKYESRIAYWRSHEDGSSTNAINEGVQRARGAVVGLLAGDDWYEPGSLRGVIERFRSNPALDVLSCGTRFAYYDASGNYLRDKVFVDEAVLVFDLPRLFRNPLTCGRFIKKAAFLQAGGFNASYKTSDDLDFFLRLYLSRPKSAVNTTLTYSYRAHSGSRTLRGDRESIIAMARDNMHIAAKYLDNPEVTKEERKTLLGFHDEFATLVVWNSLRSLRFSQAGEFALRAWRMRAAWPLFLLRWLMSQTHSKIQGKWTH